MFFKQQHPHFTGIGGIGVAEVQLSLGCRISGPDLKVSAPAERAGVARIGMSGIAEVLLKLGTRVSGPGLKLSPTTRRVAAVATRERRAGMGARVCEGHAA